MICPSSDAVVLIHGLTGHSVLLRPIRSHLQRLGFAVRDWSYWTLPFPITEHSQRLQSDLVRWFTDQSSVRRIHLVGHSMGGIVIRAMLSGSEFPDVVKQRVGRVVQLVPPNHGSPVATGFCRLGLGFQALQDLSDRHGSFVTGLPDPSGEYCMGILAASRDRVVPLENTHLTHAADHQVVRAGHTTILFRRRTQTLVGNFLRSGAFTEVPGGEVSGGEGSVQHSP